MPTYKYHCDKCGEIFEHVEHVAEHETATLREPQTGQPLRCPKCGSESVQHHPTTFYARTSKKS